VFTHERCRPVLEEDVESLALKYLTYKKKGEEETPQQDRECETPGEEPVA
jgi:hypothetical protein